MSSTSLLMNSGSSDGWPARAATTTSDHDLGHIAKHQRRTTLSTLESNS
jgi:hypothetical protein